MSAPVGGRGASPATQSASDLSGHEVIVVFNPAARDGRIGQELPRLKAILEGHGAHVIPIETLPDLHARRERIQSTIRDVLDRTPLPSNPHATVRQRLPKILILPYGGDGTIWETVGEAVQAANISLGNYRQGADPSSGLQAKLAFILAKKGTASDNAVQMGGPSRARSLPRFINGSVELPYWFPIIETPSPQGPSYEVAGHSYSLGVGGYLFAKREMRRAENPTGFWNQGLRSYLAMIPSATFNRYGWLGIDVQVRHFDAQGEKKLETRLLGSEVIVSPNRIIAGVGGVPGAWGETKLVILPPGPRGLLALGEFIFRGMATKAGMNLVGPQNRLRTLHPDRQLNILPGERIEVSTHVPDSFDWDILRLAQQKFGGSGTARGIYKWLGLGRSGEPIPTAGEALTVPAQRNGDVVEPQSQFTVRSSSFDISILAHPKSLGVRLARSSALANQSDPLVSDQQLVAHVLPDNAPKLHALGETGTYVRTPYISQARLMELIGRGEYALPMDRIPELFMAARQVHQSAHLENLASRHLHVEGLQEYLSSVEGQKWLPAQQAPGRALMRRSLSQGVPLGLGIGALFGAEALADSLGLDPVADRELRFGMAVYSAHAAQANLGPLWEATVNRHIFHRPFDYMRLRSARVGGELLHQYEFFRHGSTMDALGGSWRTGALAMGASQTWWRRGVRLGTLPIRAAWNMGHGLMFSRLTETLVRDLPEDAMLRSYGPTLAFFMPDLGRILAPHRTASLLQRRSIQVAGRVFAGAFLADMGYTGWQHLSLGEAAGFENQINFQAAELRRQNGDSSWWRGVVRFLAPNLSAHMDSHEYFFGGANRYRREVLERGQVLGAQTLRELSEDIPTLLTYLGGNWEDTLGRPVELSQLDREIRGQLSVLPETTPDPVAWVQAEFSGYALTRSEVETSLVRIRLKVFQEQVATALAQGAGRSTELPLYFNEQGLLLSGQGERLEDYLASTAHEGLPLDAFRDQLASG